MIVKGNDIIELKIISLQDGQELERVKDIIYDPYTNEIRALLIDKGGWFSDAKVVLTKDIHSIGEDAVIIPSENHIKKASDVPKRIASIAKDNQYLTKTNIITEQGKEIGFVTDIYFDSVTGQVSEIEVSQGLLKNIQSGTKRVKVADILTIGENTTIVKSYTEEKFEEQGQHYGIQGSMNTAKHQTTSVIEQVKQKTQELTQRTQDTLHAMKESPRTDRIIGQVRNEAKQTQKKLKQEIQAVRQHPTTKNALDDLKLQAEKAKEVVQETTKQAQHYQKNRHKQAIQVKTGYPAPTSGEYQPIGMLGGKSNVTLKKGRTTPPNKQSRKQAFKLVRKQKSG